MQITIRHADSEETLTLDQTKKGSIGGLLEPIGTFRFDKGTAGWVEISNGGTAGYVVVDAVQWVAGE